MTHLHQRYDKARFIHMTHLHLRVKKYLRKKKKFDGCLPVDRSPNCSGITSRKSVIPMTEKTNIIITSSKTMLVMSEEIIKRKKGLF